MSILGMASEILRDKQKQKQRGFIKRRDAFFAEYKELANKYKCDWNPLIVVGERGQSAKPQLEIIDATSFLEEENKKENKEIIKNGKKIIWK